MGGVGPSFGGRKWQPSCRVYIRSTELGSRWLGLHVGAKLRFGASHAIPLDGPFGPILRVGPYIRGQLRTTSFGGGYYVNSYPARTT